MDRILYWSGDVSGVHRIPPVGTDVESRAGLGRGTVLGYVTHDHGSRFEKGALYIGLRVRLHAPPPWFVEQNEPEADGSWVATLYGAEIQGVPS